MKISLHIRLKSILTAEPLQIARRAGDWPVVQTSFGNDSEAAWEYLQWRHPCLVNALYRVQLPFLPLDVGPFC